IGDSQDAPRAVRHLDKPALRVRQRNAIAAEILDGRKTKYVAGILAVARKAREVTQHPVVRVDNVSPHVPPQQPAPWPDQLFPDSERWKLDRDALVIPHEHPPPPHLDLPPERMRPSPAEPRVALRCRRAVNAVPVQGQ